MRRSCLLFLREKALLLPFDHSAEAAMDATRRYYEELWPGASIQHLEFQLPVQKWMPFHGCSGELMQKFTALVEEQSPDAAKGIKVNHVGPYVVGTVFHKHTCVVYAGLNVHRKEWIKIAEQVEGNSDRMRLPVEADHQIEEHEAFANKMGHDIEYEVKRAVLPEMETQAVSMIRRYYEGAIRGIQWDAQEKTLDIKEIEDYYLPVYVIPFRYQNLTHYCYVGGHDLFVYAPNVGTPSPLTQGVQLAIGITLVLIFAALVTKTSMENAAREQEELEAKAVHDLQIELQNASQQKSDPYDDIPAFDRGTPLPRDPQGFYSTMELRGDESNRALHQQYEQLVAKYHPNNKETGDSYHMHRIDEAYKVLRNPDVRASYDKM